MLHGGLLNPDSAMRLVRLEAIIQAHAPLSVVVRDGSGRGTMLHWSPLLDSLSLVLAAPAAVFAGWHGALAAVAPIVDSLGMAALGAALVWAVAPFAERQSGWLPALLASAAGPVLGYGLPGAMAAVRPSRCRNPAAAPAPTAPSSARACPAGPAR